MRFKIFAFDPELKENVKNGGTVWLQNISEAIKELGHESEICDLTNPVEADYVIIQSEWAHLDCFTKSVGKKIVMLGHFKGGAYSDPSKIEADYFVSQWKGELIDNFPHKVIYMPHAFPSNRESVNSNKNLGITFVGNTYALRKEDWLEGINVEKITGIHPNELNGVYKNSRVNLNIHGDFQKGIVSDEPSSLSNYPGYMINERFWHIIGAGGLIVSDFIPQMLDFFSEDELIVAKTKEEFKEKVDYYSKHRKEGIDKLRRARYKILNNHTYKHRIKQLIETL